MTGQDDFLSDVTRPRRPRPGVGQLLGHALLGLIVVSGLVGALLLARPALDVEHQSPPEAPAAATNP
ncbi:hypothetical protein [Streptomyces hainanensis]|uniref:Uncharacterized protein n=1 Tax=Streptomyces hainanensis TaxID=402648 RepID=A0A4R4TGU7_9ACTN|nr:hypothetical protein [Streptomyces hainanensis]TDC74442.1 hypothetical protein E1283_15690 [Streptomyces hainanensis]